MRKEKLEELNKIIDSMKTVEIEYKPDVHSINEMKDYFIKIEKHYFKTKDGEIFEREQVLKNNSNGDGVLILPVTKENTVILVVQPRVFTKTRVGIEIPAGLIEKNEPPINAAKRELEEETGYTTDNIKLLKEFYQDQGSSKGVNYAYIALNCEKKYNQHLDKSEYISFFECDYQEALELAQMGYIAGASSLLTLELSKKYLLK